MATPTISGTTTITISGGTISDRVSITDLVPVGGSRLSKLFGNSGYTPTPQSQLYIWNSAAFSDLTGAEIWLENGSNNQALIFQAGGDCVIGSPLDGEPRDFRLHLGDSDIAGTHIISSAVLPFDPTDKIVCSGASRYYLICHLIHANSALTGEPAARNPMSLENNNSDSEIRFTFYGGRMAADNVNYSLASLTVAKPNGTMMQYYKLTSAVSIRDVEYYDGFIDWRPIIPWAPPTRGVFISDSWIKFLGEIAYTDSSPLIFGNEAETFLLVLDNSGEFTSDTWWQHGIWTLSDVAGRVIYNNMSGVAWAAELAVYNRNTNNRNIKIENHLTLNFNIIDQVGDDVVGAEVKYTTRDPSYATSTTTANVQFLIADEKTIIAISAGDGSGQIGNDGGDLAADALCIEAFQKVGNNTGADVDGAYHSIASSRADYDSYTSNLYSVYSWQKKIIFEVSHSPVIAGSTGDGLQEIGAIQMTDDASITAVTIGAVGAGLASINLDEIYDRLTKFSFDNDLDHIAVNFNGLLDFGASDVDFDSGHAVDISESGGIVDVRASSIASDGVVFSGLKTTGDILINGGISFDNNNFTAAQLILNSDTDLTSVTINGDLRINTGADSTLDFSNVTVTGLVYNDDAIHTLTINSLGLSSITAANPGSGNGQTDVLSIATLVVNVVNETDGLPNTQARVHVEASGGGPIPDGTAIIDRAVVDGSGQVSGTVNGFPQSFTGLVVDGTDPGLFVPKPISGTIEAAGLTLNVSLVSDE